VRFTITNKRFLKTKIKDNDGIGAVNMNIGVMYYYQNDNKNAIKYYNKSRDQLQKSKQSKKIAGT
jgi:prefoldin subunit 5